MARSHPPTLLTLAARALGDECALANGSRVLVAVSGGGDSTALLHVLARLAPRFALTLAAHGVDHGLRAEAGAELDLAEALAARLGVPFTRARLAVAPGGNLQARARSARHASLRRAAEACGAAAIATAHHADDRAETVLMRLMRGSGPAGLAALPPRSGLLIRPLLRARRSDVAAHLARHELVFARDPSNDDPRFLRTRVRRELLPLLEQLSPQIAGHLCALSDALLAGGDARGEPTLSSLNRAQRAQLERALRLAQLTAGVRLSGGREIRLDPLTSEPRVTSARRAPGAANLSPVFPALFGPSNFCG